MAQQQEAAQGNDREWYFGGGSDTAVWTVLQEGVPGKLMVSFTPLTEDERWAVVTLLRSWGGLPDPLAPSGDASAHQGHQYGQGQHENAREENQ